MVRMQTRTGRTKDIAFPYKGLGVAGGVVEGEIAWRSDG